MLWLVFAPLARNATAAALREVVAEIHAGAKAAEKRAELYTALLVMATIDPWGHNLMKELVIMVEDKEAPPHSAKASSLRHAGAPRPPPGRAVRLDDA